MPESDVTPLPDQDANDIDQMIDDDAARVGLTAALKDINAGLVNSINTVVDQIADQTFVAENLNTAWKAPVTSYFERFQQEDPAGRSLIMQETTWAKRYLQRNTDKAGRSDDPRLFNLRRYLAGVLGLNPPASTVPAFYETLTRVAANPGSPDLAGIPGAAESLSPQFTDVINGLRNTVSTSPDGPSVYWQRMAQYVGSSAAADNVPTTLADLMFFMQYTQQLFPLDITTPYAWASEADKANYVNGLYTVVAKVGEPTAATFLGALQTFTALHPVPISVAANCAELALAYLLTPRIGGRGGAA